MSGKLLIEAASATVGILLFAAVLKIAGLENILGNISEFAPEYFLPFMAVTLALFFAAAYRWKVLLEGEGVKVPLLTLLKYKFMVFGINYLTPVARLGGEPLKVMLLKQQKVKSASSLSSVVVDNFVGMGLDAVIAAGILITLFISGAIPDVAGKITLAFVAATVIAVGTAYMLLTKKKGIFSAILNFTARTLKISKSKLFQRLAMVVVGAEGNIRILLSHRPRSLIAAGMFAALSWPLSVLQYKFALLLIGFDATYTLILISIVTLSLTALLPVPAALGVQEAGQFSVFQLLAQNPATGIALSLIMRIKDIILLLISFVLLSLEGSTVLRTFAKR